MQPPCIQLCCCRLLLAAPGLRQALTSESTGATYTLNTLKLGFADAEAQCNELGGHVVCYGGIAEQVEVELYYVTRVRGGEGKGRWCWGGAGWQDRGGRQICKASQCHAACMSSGRRQHLHCP